MYAGGEFTQVENADRSITDDRTNVFSFNATTGAVSPLTVSMDGAVWANASAGTSLYVGGTFTTVNGVARRGLAKLDPWTGAVDPAFDAHLDGSVRDARVVAGRLPSGP